MTVSSFFFRNCKSCILFNYQFTSDQVCCVRIARRLSFPPPPSWSFHILHFPTTTERNVTKLERKQVLNVLFSNRPINKKMAALVSDLPRHFRRLLCNNWTKFDRKQVLSVFWLIIVGVFDDLSTNLVSDWLRHFWHLCNRWTEFDENSL